jgi:hypothetical protein
MSKLLKLRVRTVLQAIEHIIVIESTKFVSDLTIEIEKYFRIKPENQRLVFLGIEITNEELKNLDELKICDQSLIKLVIKPREYRIVPVILYFLNFKKIKNGQNLLKMGEGEINKIDIFVKKKRMFWTLEVF